MLKKFVLCLALVGHSLARPENSKVASTLQKTLEKEETGNVFVSFKVGTSAVLQAITDTRFPSREDRMLALREALILNADNSQAKVTALLGVRPFKSLWITNQVYLQHATLEEVYAIAQIEDVGGITEEQIVSLHEPVQSGPIVKRANPKAAEWGIKKIQAEEAQELLRQFTANTSVAAAPVRVSTIDTGVRFTHEALFKNFLGEYGWYDPYMLTESPNDQNGHGTHTTGTICGSGGIGVYPDAKWLACKGCATSSCSQFALTDCGQFIVCPTLPDGTKPDCSKAPHLVSNSWGGGRGNEWFDSVIAAWHAAKIIPLFSIGNSGPSCNSANSPGDRDVIGVGATTIDDGISSFSSVGPTIDGRMKPEVSAPGSNVMSAYNTANDDYRSLSGTSMACPHAAGLTALLFAKNPDLAYEKVTELMFQGVERDPLQSSGRTCEGIPDNQFPNHFYGQGRINAFLSLKTLIEQ